ncbi:MAG TPA: DNA repair protein RadC [Casimicrobiaceae bacterium]|nr:DNA repair protein RadC [Casimicrobiaceae bacterium]
MPLSCARTASHAPVALARVRRDEGPERPRERLAALGAAALTDAELLAVVLGTGARGASALDLARGALARHGGLAALVAAGPSHKTPGFGRVRRAQLCASVELVRRAARESLARGALLTSPEAVRDYLRLVLAGRDCEAFLVLFVDSQHRLIAAEELFRGTLAQTSVYPREVVKAALAHNAAAVIFAHNHPSGVAEPSRADELLTQALKSALGLVEVRTLDHFVVAGGEVVSFAERGLL